MLYKFRNLLLADYELVEDSKYYLRLSIVFGLILIAYVFLFDPYESLVAPLKYAIPLKLVQLGYGINASFIIYGFYWLVFHKIGFGKGTLTWKTYQQLLFVVFTVTVIGITGTIYHRSLIDVGEVSISYVAFVTAPKTILISASLATISVLLEKLHLNNKRFEAVANEIVESIPEVPKIKSVDNALVCLDSPIVNQSIEVLPESLLYLKSYGNYVEIKLRNRTGSILIRAPLHYVAQKLDSYPYIIQCHRQYYVNINQVLKPNKCRGQIKLVIKDEDNEIPVSKRYRKVILPLLK